ncbi:MAG: PEP-CTERM sorting domain-containing protein [Pseudomonadota bacterium]
MASRHLTAVLAAVAASCISVSAMAAPVVYNYSTSTFVSSPDATLRALLGTSASVSGSFVYDAATPFTTYSQNIGYAAGGALYSGAISQLTGTVNSSVSGLTFTDGSGTISQGNEAAPPGLDWFTMNADATPRPGQNTTPAEYARDLAGFTVGAYTLHNVRLYWIEGSFGATDFIASDALLPTPPSFNGVLALDFVLTADPTNIANTPYNSRTVYFTGLTVMAAPVPEPGTTGLALAGMAGVALALRRRKA